MQVKTKKVYKFNMPKVKNELVQVLKKRKNESSIADLIADSGLPKFQVEQAIKEVSNEYNGHLKVTESGELLYYFPTGMRSQVTGFIPALKGFFKGFLQVMGKVLAFLFKIWIVVMLVGYFLLFIAILLLSIAVAVAGTAANRDRRSSKGGGFFLVIKVVELFVRIWFYGGMLEAYAPQTHRKKKGRILYKSVFAFVFGEEDPNKEWAEQEKKAVISYIQGNKGVITLEELMAMTGKNREDAQQLINRYLLEFEGSPEVTENGTIVFLFPALLRTTVAAAPVAVLNAPKKRLIPFNYNEKKTNGWIAFFNVFNMFFSAYFLGNILLNPMTQIPIPLKYQMDFSFVYQVLYVFLAEIIADPNRLILGVLGIVPLSFAGFFFLIPVIRNIKRVNANNAIKQENLRKRIYNYLFQRPEQANPAEIIPASDVEKPADAARYTRRVFDEFAAEKRGDIDATANGVMLYKLSEFKREIDDVRAYRNTVNLADYAVGNTVFDTGE